MNNRSSKDSFSDYDMIVVGAGPAGMATAIYSARMGWKTLVLDKGPVGGLAVVGPYIDNYPGFVEPISNIEFGDRLKQQAEKCSAEVRELVEVIDTKVDQKPMRVISTEGDFSTKVVVLATGILRRKINVPGENFRGVGYDVTCNIVPIGRPVAVVGGGNSAVMEALYLDKLDKRPSVIFLIHRRNALRASQPLQKELLEDSNVHIIWNTIVTEIWGKEIAGVNKISLRNVLTGEESSFRVKAIFIAIGTIPNNSLAKKIGIELTEEGLIKVDAHQRTNIPRIYAAGDITSGLGQISVAVGEGTTAAISAFFDMRGGD
ncbi:MAG: NAD(P)/FAD-dependent oxidoreductase [Candidatus Hermodarchaeota archaeon]